MFLWIIVQRAPGSGECTDTEGTDVDERKPLAFLLPKAMLLFFSFTHPDVTAYVFL